MAYQKAIIAQLKTPQDENGVRYDVFMKTHLNAIISTDEDGNQISFADTISNMVKEEATTIINENVIAYDVFSEGTDGLVPGPSEANSTTYLRSDGKWGTPVGTTYTAFTGCTETANGTSGLVPQPAKNTATLFLRADGTWANPSYSTYSAFTGATETADGTTGLVPKPSGGTGYDEKYLNANGKWQTITFPDYTEDTYNTIVSYFKDTGIYISSASVEPGGPCLWAQTS